MSPTSQQIWDGAAWRSRVADPNARKIGANYVAAESLLQGAEDLATINLQTLINRVTGNRVLTFPEGVFAIPDNFAYNYFTTTGATGGDGVRLGHPTAGGAGCRGLSGSGRNTVFRMNSSNRAQVTSGTNNFFLIHATTASANPRISVEFSQFTLEGVAGYNQDHDHGGLRLSNTTNSLIEDVYITGIRGSDKVPPGETFSFATQTCDNLTLNRVEIDGRRNGTRVAASTVGINSSTFVTISNCYLHHAYSGGGLIAWYRSFDCQCNDTRAEYPGTAAKSGYCFNQEEVSRITYRNPVMICDRSGGNPSGLHMSLSQDATVTDATDGVITIINPTWDTTSVGGGRMVVETWALGGSAQQLQRRPPDVYQADGVTRIPFYYLNAYIGNGVY